MLRGHFLSPCRSTAWDDQGWEVGLGCVPWRSFSFDRVLCGAYCTRVYENAQHDEGGTVPTINKSPSCNTHTVRIDARRGFLTVDPLQQLLADLDDYVMTDRIDRDDDVAILAISVLRDYFNEPDAVDAPSDAAYHNH